VIIQEHDGPRPQPEPPPHLLHAGPTSTSPFPFSSPGTPRYT
jgi:hypothetical protein